MCWSASAANNKRYVNIVFIGNSITFGAGYRSLSMMRSCKGCIVFKQVPGSGFGQVFQ